MKEKNAWQTSPKERVLYYSLSFEYSAAFEPLDPMQRAICLNHI